VQNGSIYFVRHGQAGTRQLYDRLSDLGRGQAQCLGEYLAGSGPRFRTVISGGLERQKETGSIVAQALGWSEIPVDARWNEFDLDDVYRTIGPKLAADDPVFARDYAKMMAEAEHAHSPVHRQWTTSDVAVFQAWRLDRYRCEGETFGMFCERVRDAVQALGSLPKPALVFTSATPIGLTISWAAALEEMEGMQLAGRMWNCAWTELMCDRGEMRVVSYNNVPHLEDRMRTKR
jgi:broad specificity phosphatase PhoE